MSELAVVARQFVIFCCIGLLSTAVNYAVFFALLQLVGLFYLLASATGFLTGMYVSFALNMRYNFKERKLASARNFLLYAAVNAVSLSASLGLLYFLVESLAMQPLLANLFAILLSTVINFAGLRHIRSISTAAHNRDASRLGSLSPQPDGAQPTKRKDAPREQS